MKKVMRTRNPIGCTTELEVGEVYDVLDETPDLYYLIRSVRGHNTWYLKENFERVMTYIGGTAKHATDGKDYVVEDSKFWNKYRITGDDGNKWDCDKDQFIDPVDHTVEGSQVMKYVGTDMEYMTKGKNYNVKDDGKGFYVVRCDNGNEIREPHDCFIEPSTCNGGDYKALDVLRTPSCLMVDNFVNKVNTEALAIISSLSKSKMAEKHPHYYANVKNLEFIDVYDVIELFGVKNSCLQHVLKKIMVLGGRGHKSHDTDLQDIYDTLDRYKIMRGELHNEEG